MKLKTFRWMASLFVAATGGFLIGSFQQIIRLPDLNLPVMNLPELNLNARAQERLDVPSRAVACAAGLLQGSYAFTAEGVVPSTDEKYATIGIIVFDGQGKLSLSNTQSIDGRIVFPAPITGVYGLNGSCGGRITLSTGSIFDIVVSNNGRELYLIQVNSGYVVTGTAKKL